MRRRFRSKMPAHDPTVYLLHIRDCCEHLSECLTLRDERAAPEHILLDAACRNLEILGEASRKVGPEFRARHSSLPWRQMNDLRNVLIHNYDGADPVMIWGIVNQQIPALLEQIRSLLKDPGPTGL